MSRTYRRKNVPLPYWVAEEHDCGWNTDGTWYSVWVKRDPKSQQYKAKKAKFYGDAGTFRFKEPGPAWFRNLFTERPQRRAAKKELQKYLRADGEYEVMLLPKNPLDYWT